MKHGTMKALRGDIKRLQWLVAKLLATNEGMFKRAQLVFVQRLRNHNRTSQIETTLPPPPTEISSIATQDQTEKTANISQYTPCCR